MQNTDNLKLYLPIGTLASERLLFLLEFLTSHDVKVRMIKLPVRAESHDNSQASSQRSVSVERARAKDNSNDHNQTILTSKLSEIERSSEKMEDTEEFELRTPTLTIQRDFLNFPLQKSKTLPSTKFDEESIFSLIDQPCLVINDKSWVSDFFDIFKILSKTYTFRTDLMPETETAAIFTILKRIECTVDVYVIKILDFLHNFSGHSNIILQSHVKRSRAKKSKFDANLKTLYENLDYFEKEILSHSRFVIGKNFTLADLFLTSSLNRMFRFFFDRKITKFWLPNLTQWFLECVKLKEASAIYGRFKTCKQSYTTFFEQQPSLPHKAPPVEETKPTSVREKLTNWIQIKNSPGTLEKSFESHFDELKLSELKDAGLRLWSFKFLETNENPDRNEGFFGSDGAPDEMEEFYANFVEDMKDLSADLTTYLCVYSNCEALNSTFSLRKNKFEQCPKHYGRYFVRKHLVGFFVYPFDELPEEAFKYEKKDLIEVKEEDDFYAYLKRIMINKDEVMVMEKIYQEDVL